MNHYLSPCHYLSSCQSGNVILHTRKDGLFVLQDATGFTASGPLVRSQVVKRLGRFVWEAKLTSDEATNLRGCLGAKRS